MIRRSNGNCTWGYVVRTRLLVDELGTHVIDFDLRESARLASRLVSYV